MLLKIGGRFSEKTRVIPCFCKTFAG